MQFYTSNGQSSLKWTSTWLHTVKSGGSSLISEKFYIFPPQMHGHHYFKIKTYILYHLNYGDQAQPFSPILRNISDWKCMRRGIISNSVFQRDYKHSYVRVMMQFMMKVSRYNTLNIPSSNTEFKLLSWSCSEFPILLTYFIHQNIVNAMCSSCITSPTLSKKWLDNLFAELVYLLYQ